MSIDFTNNCFCKWSAGWFHLLVGKTLQDGVAEKSVVGQWGHERYAHDIPPSQERRKNGKMTVFCLCKLPLPSEGAVPGKSCHLASWQRSFGKKAAVICQGRRGLLQRIKGVV